MFILNVGRFPTGIEVEDNDLFTSCAGEKRRFSKMPVQSMSDNGGVLFLGQYVDMTVIKCYNKKEQREHGNTKATGTPKAN